MSKTIQRFRSWNESVALLNAEAWNIAMLKPEQKCFQLGKRCWTEDCVWKEWREAWNWMETGEMVECNSIRTILLSDDGQLFVIKCLTLWWPWKHPILLKLCSLSKIGISWPVLNCCDLVMKGRAEQVIPWKGCKCIGYWCSWAAPERAGSCRCSYPLQTSTAAKVHLNIWSAGCWSDWRRKLRRK